MWVVQVVIYGLDLIQVNRYPWSNHIRRVFDGWVRSDRREAAALSGNSAAFHSRLARAHWSSTPEHSGAWRCVISSSKRCGKLGEPYPKRVAAWGDGEGGARWFLGDVERLLRCTSGSKNSTYSFLAHSSCSSFLQFLRRCCRFTPHEDLIEV
jgi:hypothetical protein